MEMNDDFLERLSHERCRQAHGILRRSGIVEAWRQAGAEVNVVGSLRMGLMMKHRDIDLHIYSEPLTIEGSFAVMARVAACPAIGRIECRNLTATDERCIEWHAAWAEPDGETWTIDMIHIERGSRYDGYFERMADGVVRAADDEMRRAILRLKWETPDTEHIMGVEYYRAVIEGGVRTYDGLTAWRAANPVCGVVESCEKLLDACAAPGGKSVLLAERCGHVTACELHPHRVALIEAYASRMHRGNVTAVQADSTVFRPEWEGAFDGVLCDVPCTGLGTKAENPDLPLRKEAADLEGLLPVQRAILENCSHYVRAGGYLYYATCSLLGEENDGAAEAFLAAHPAFSSVPAESPLPHDVTRFGLQFLPDTAYGAGFYVAKFRKEAP